MFLSISKKTVFVVVAVLLAVVLTFVTIGVASQASAVPSNGKTVVIDAGHGGVDGGVQGRLTGAKESEINLAIARRLADLFSDNGYDVVMTRTDSGGLYGTAKTGRKQKDMAARRDIINGSNAQLVISVHCNYYPREYVTGAQAFYASGSEDGERCAVAVQGMLNTALGGNRVAAKGDYYILECSAVPSVLVECGFLSNSNEEKQLLTAEYQQKVAYAIYSGAAALLGEQHQHKKAG